MVKYYCDLCGKETNGKTYVPHGCEYLSKYLSKEIILCPLCVKRCSDFVLKLVADDEGRLKFDTDD